MAGGRPGGGNLPLPFPDFAAAARAVLRLVYERLDFGFWADTLVEGERQRVVAVIDDCFGVREGRSYPWLDRLGATTLTSGLRLDLDMARRESEVRLSPVATAPVRAYLGLPIYAPDGRAVGAISAADRLPQPDEVLAELDLLELLARLLGTLATAALPAGS